MSLHPQAADEGQALRSRHHAQDCGNGAQFHHHVDLYPGLAKAVIDNLADGAAPLKADEILPVDGFQGDPAEVGEGVARGSNEDDLIV